MTKPVVIALNSSFTCITILYAMSGIFFYDALRAFIPLSTEICIATALALCFFYGTAGVYVRNDNNETTRKAEILGLFLLRT